MNLEGSVAFDVEKKDVSLDLVVTPDVDLWHGQADEEVARVQFRLDVVRHEGGETFDCYLQNTLNFFHLLYSTSLNLFKNCFLLLNTTKLSISKFTLVLVRDW